MPCVCGRLFHFNQFGCNANVICEKKIEQLNESNTDKFGFIINNAYSAIKQHKQQQLQQNAYKRCVLKLLLKYRYIKVNMLVGSEQVSSFLCIAARACNGFYTYINTYIRLVEKNIPWILDSQGCILGFKKTRNPNALCSKAFSAPNWEPKFGFTKNCVVWMLLCRWETDRQFASKIIQLSQSFLEICAFLLHVFQCSHNKVSFFGCSTRAKKKLRWLWSMCYRMDRIDIENGRVERNCEQKSNFPENEKWQQTRRRKQRQQPKRVLPSKTKIPCKMEMTKICILNMNDGMHVMHCEWYYTAHAYTHYIQAHTRTHKFHILLQCALIWWYNILLFGYWSANKFTRVA